MEIDLILGDKPRKHSEWLDEIYRTATTKYWMAVDTDILFVGRDWLTDMLSIMEANPDLYLLACEPRMGREGVVEPVGKETVDMGEAVATWLFVVRTTLRDQLPDASFAFHVDEQPSRNDRKLCYDTGGRLLAKMRAQGLRYGIMPSWFQMKYHHFGSLSWWAQYADSNDPAILFKKFQIGDIQRRLQTGRLPAGPF
jgi:hypothetical protein